MCNTEEIEKILNALEECTKKHLTNLHDLILQGDDYLFRCEEAYWSSVDEYKLNNISLKLFSLLFLKYNGFLDQNTTTHEQIVVELKRILKSESVTGTEIFKDIKINKNAVFSNFYNDFEKFKKYKQNILVYGTIIFSENFQKVLVVMQKKKANMAFPKGKKNSDESGKQCAIRETWEEIGYDVTEKISNFRITIFDKLTFYLVFNVPENTSFEPKCKNEILKIFWVNLNRIPQIDSFKIVNTAINELKAFIIANASSKFKFKNITKILDDEEIPKEINYEEDAKRRNEIFLGKIGKYFKEDDPNTLRTVEDKKVHDLNSCDK